MSLDYKEIFRALPHNYILFAPDDPDFTILEITDSFLSRLGMTRDHLSQKKLFDIFPDNPNGQVNTETALRTHLKIVVKNKEYRAMPIVRYDIPVMNSNEFSLHYWSPESYPILDEKGEIKMIIHTAIDISSIVKKGLHIY